MTKTDLFLGTEKQIFRASVEAVMENGGILVSSADGALSRQACDLLETGGEEPLRLACGDRVLVWLSGLEGERPMIIGRIGPSHLPPAPKSDPPRQLVIEARESMCLKCGDGSITIRADGKILIQGKDLVSRALRMNRIKGGAVSIN
jgi:hypothetical protein